MIKDLKLLMLMYMYFPLDSKEQFSLNRVNENLGSKENLKEAFEF